MTKDLYAEIQHQTIYRQLGNSLQDGILSCGFLRKLTSRKSQIDFQIHYYSCFVLLSGSGEYWDETSFRADLVPGCVVQRLPERIHSTKIHIDGMWLEFYVSFGQNTYNALVDLGLLDATTPVKYFDNPEQLLSTFQKLLSRMSSVPDQELGTCYLEAQQIAITLTTRMEQKKNSPEILKACRLLDRDLERELSLVAIAKELSMGYETFRKQFFKEMHMSPDAYRQRKRMQNAQIMLMEGESVKSIAKALGYNDTYAFSKQFKRFYGYAPTHLYKHI